MTESDRHRPVDTDLIERYVLDRVSEEERIQVESLILEDAQWAEALRREQLLAAGARRLGRERLRARLRERARQEIPLAIPWTRVAAIAASVVIVLALAIYRLLPPETASEADAAKGKKSDITANESPAPRSAEHETKETELNPPDETERRIRADKGRPATASPSTPQPRAEAGGSTAGELSAAAPSPSQSTVVFWTEGRVLERVSEAEPLRAADEAKPKDEFLRNQQRAVQEEVFAKSAVIGQQATGGGFSLSQRQASEADRSSQWRAQQFSPSAVPTLVRIAPDSLHLTVFLDPPLDDSLLRAARIEAAGPDSFIVTVGSRQFGYRFGAGQQQSTKQR